MAQVEQQGKLYPCLYLSYPELGGSWFSLASQFESIPFKQLQTSCSTAMEASTSH